VRALPLTGWEQGAELREVEDAPAAYRAMAAGELSGRAVVVPT
jgi:hypothetical protein